MNLQLIKPDKTHKQVIVDMLEEWIEFNKQNDVNNSPYAIFKNSYEDFDYYLDHLDNKDDSNGMVADSTFFLYDEINNKALGAINIRHYLNDYLLNYGGHIGYGIRPSERQKGYATKILQLGLIKCKELNLDKILLVCDKNNIGSVKTIKNNHGILENEILQDNKVIQRYWITL
ncbi:GNAT family N-acetyltransferase [Mycoplasma bradburyae]|uniref:GNAT family N-acetyltransferase n=1 Tax=Mycoplasma bradburyae TaxID=2963128 RepID=UPI002340F384|nr:GNAT family N-acetyltransferase [Mycoplasma bradburyae]MDC4163119.1 GNAT family N-acetyltransferase [Mycoplasma bradburyae]MDC4182435.1 GNAT family N-acetyltransferase [Mycoplasma bradburyae]MDC4183901.1 GNAT family N-acetyltransferase [Mycoplasma bradburyae]